MRSGATPSSRALFADLEEFVQDHRPLAEAHAALERLEQRYAARDAIRWAIELVEAGGSRPK